MSDRSTRMGKRPKNIPGFISDKMYFGNKEIFDGAAKLDEMYPAEPPYTVVVGTKAMENFKKQFK